MKADDTNKAIQEMTDYSQKWHDGTSSRNKISNTYNGLAVIQAQMNNLGKEIKKEEGKTLEEAYSFSLEYHSQMQEGIEQFLQDYTKGIMKIHHIKKEIRASMDVAIRNQGALIKALEIQIGQMSKVLQERGFRSLPSSTETNPRDHVKSITTTEEADTPLIHHIGPDQYAVLSLKENDEMLKIALSHASVPFPSCLKEKDYDEKEVIMKLKKLQVNSTESAKAKGDC
ncbi:hypothetical protein Tco_0859942 [Tanacetum coccineum]|uniref:Uncharacterized protein n=1 Tax=Tanacetum coccineum TaxID=301880 RepID=A0ABQ5BDH3_9ASTR